MFSLEDIEMSVTDSELFTVSDNILCDLVYSQYDNISSPFRFLSPTSLYETVMGKFEHLHLTLLTIPVSNIDTEVKLKLENILKNDNNQQINNQRTIDLLNNQHIHTVDNFMKKENTLNYPPLNIPLTCIPSSTEPESSSSENDNIITVGIYTRAERREKIRRYQKKKKIYFKRRLLGIEKKNRYKCRSVFARTRQRSGGRFVKKKTKSNT